MIGEWVGGEGSTGKSNNLEMVKNSEYQLNLANFLEVLSILSI